MRWRDWYGRGRYVPELPEDFPHHRKKSGQRPPVVPRSSRPAAERPCLFHALRNGSVPFGIKVFKWSSNGWTNPVRVRFCDKCAQAFQQKGVQHHKTTNIWWFAASSTMERGTATMAVPVKAGCFFHAGKSQAASIDIRLMAYASDSLCTNWFRVGVCGRCHDVIMAKRTLKMKQTHVWWQTRLGEAPPSRGQPASAKGAPIGTGGNPPAPAHRRFGTPTPEPGYRRQGIRRDLPRR
jgi:hypothetical protein